MAMVEATNGGNREGQAPPSEGTSAQDSVQDSPEPAFEREVIEVAPGKTSVAVITPKLVYRINWDARGVYPGGDPKSH